MKYYTITDYRGITPTMHRLGNNLNFTTPTNSLFIPLPSMLKIGETLPRLSVIHVFWCGPSHFRADPCSWVLDLIIIPYQSSSRFPSNLMTSYLIMLVSLVDVSCLFNRLSCFPMQWWRRTKLIRCRSVLDYWSDHFLDLWLLETWSFLKRLCF